MNILESASHRLSTGPVRLMRNHSGVARSMDGGRVIKFGLGPGTPDFVGFKSITITPEMVGQQVAVFVGVEAKTENDRERAEQRLWIKMAAERGARVGFARSVADAEAIIHG